MIIGRFAPHLLLAAFIAAGILQLAAEPEAQAGPIMQNLIPPVARVQTPKLTPLPKDGNWENLLVTDEMVIDVIPSSLRAVPKPTGYEVATTMRIGFFQEIDVKGTAEKGWYYVNEMVAVCSEDVLRINKSTVYSKDGKPLMTGQNLGDLRNPKNVKSFVTVWLHVTCNDLKNKRPPTMI